MFFLALVALALADVHSDWLKFKITYEKSYSTHEEAHRFAIFQENMKRAETLNKLDTSAFYGINQFSDMSAEEFAAMYSRPMARTEPGEIPMLLAPPTNWDWTKQGAVGSVKNQGACGSCWAFAITSSVEGVVKMAGGSLYDLSEQQLVDCNTPQNAGCNGGNLDYAFKYVISNGQMTESSYPYTAKQSTCKYSSSKVTARISGYGTLPAGAEDRLAQTTYTYGPLAIAVNSSPLQMYSSGILNPSSCNANALDHAVVLVGYDQKASTPYWKIRNSWGAGWGESGYFRIIMGKNACGLSNWVTYAKK
jgi:C1A family cysteine protease